MLHTAEAPERDSRAVTDAGFQVFWLLRIGFTAAPILFGLDKFFDVMTEWSVYLSSFFEGLSPFDAEGTMIAVGVIEIAAGIAVAIKPRFAAPVVAAWLAGIILNLLVLGDFYDIALRDFGLMLGALALARLAAVYDR